MPNTERAKVWMQTLLTSHLNGKSFEDARKEADETIGLKEDAGAWMLSAGNWNPKFVATSWVDRNDPDPTNDEPSDTPPNHTLRTHFTPPADLYGEGGYVPHSAEVLRRDWPILALESLIQNTSFSGEKYVGMMDWYSEQIALQSGEELLDEATSWVRTRHPTIRVALKQTLRNLRNFTVIKQDPGYALAQSSFGDMKEFMLLTGSGHLPQVLVTKHRITGPNAPVVWMRTLKAGEPTAR